MLTELNERLGGLVWVEEKVFELMGAWSDIEPHPRAKVLFATLSRHHGWHCQVLAQCLATSSQLVSAEVVAAPDPAWPAALEKLRGVNNPDGTSLRLLAIERVIDRWLEREITALTTLISPVSAAPMLRWLRFVAMDHDNDHEQARGLLAQFKTRSISLKDHSFVACLGL